MSENHVCLWTDSCRDYSLTAVAKSQWYGIDCGMGSMHQSCIDTEVSLATKDLLFSVYEKVMVKDTVAWIMEKLVPSFCEVV